MPARVLSAFPEGRKGCFPQGVSRGERGRTEVPGKGPVLIRTAGPGELVGWSPLIGLGPMTATARTRMRCRVVSLDVGLLRALCQRNPTFGMEFIRRTAVALAQRLHGTRLRLLESQGPQQ
jgi:CRP-like cAMP-binding protein